MMRSTYLLPVAVLALVVSSLEAYQPASGPKPASFGLGSKQQQASLRLPKVASTVAAAALSVVLSTTTPALASSTAAQVTLNSLPPSSISVQIGDLPVIGNLLSGTYTKVPDGSIKGTPSITIKSPTDKVKVG